MSERLIFTDRHEDPDLHTGHLTFIGVVIGLCAVAIAFGVGFQYRDSMQADIDKARGPVARPAVQNPPKPLIGCDQSGREEYFRTCRARVRSGMVGAK